MEACDDYEEPDPELVVSEALPPRSWRVLLKSSEPDAGRGEELQVALDTVHGRMHGGRSEHRSDTAAAV